MVYWQKRFDLSIITNVILRCYKEIPDKCRPAYWGQTGGIPLISGTVSLPGDVSYIIISHVVVHILPLFWMGLLVSYRGHRQNQSVPGCHIPCQPVHGFLLCNFSAPERKSHRGCLIASLRLSPGIQDCHINLRLSGSLFLRTF